MGWKNLPTWLKGGVISGGIGILGFLLFVLLPPGLKIIGAIALSGMVFLGNNFVLLRLKRINRLSKYVNSGQSRKSNRGLFTK